MIGTAAALVLASLALAAGLISALLLRAARREHDRFAARQMEAAASAATGAESARLAGESVGREVLSTLAPVARQLERMHIDVARLERERIGNDAQLHELVAGLGEDVARLHGETARLAGALSNPRSRGAWGELQLRNAVELAGMVDHCDFFEQPTLTGGEGRRSRPDMVVRLPGGRAVAVDSKLPLDAYLESCDAHQEHDRRELLRRHASALRAHARDLAGREYDRELCGSPAFVVLFIAADAIYQAALEGDPSLVSFASDRRVLIATPTTLIGLLWAIQHGWERRAGEDAARELLSAGDELYRRLERFAGHLASVGTRLDAAVDAYNDAAGSFEARLIPQARRIQRAGRADLPEPEQLQVRARELRAPARGRGAP